MAASAVHFPESAGEFTVGTPRQATEPTAGRERQTVGGTSSQRSPLILNEGRSMYLITRLGKVISAGALAFGLLLVSSADVSADKRARPATSQKPPPRPLVNNANRPAAAYPVAPAAVLQGAPIPGRPYLVQPYGSPGYVVQPYYVPTYVLPQTGNGR